MTKSLNHGVGSAAQTGALLAVSGLGVSFGGTRLFAGAAFDCLRGHITCITGPNGSGKTTLLNVLAGFFKPSEGTVRYYGREAVPFTPLTVARIGSGVARSYQTPFTVGSLSALDNVTVGRRHADETILGVLKSAVQRDGGESSMRHEARLLLERLGLGGQSELCALELSAGQRRRVDFARAVFSQSQLLLLDEPFANLDPEVAFGVAQFLRELANEGRSVLLIEHRTDFALSIADVILEISGGRLVFIGRRSTHAPEESRL